MEFHAFCLSLPAIIKDHCVEPSRSEACLHESLCSFENSRLRKRVLGPIARRTPRQRIPRRPCQRRCCSDSNFRLGCSERIDCLPARLGSPPKTENIHIWVERTSPVVVDHIHVGQNWWHCRRRPPLCHMRIVGKELWAVDSKEHQFVFYLLMVLFCRWTVVLRGVHVRTTYQKRVIQRQHFPAVSVQWIAHVRIQNCL